MAQLPPLLNALLGASVGAQSQGALLPQFQALQDRNKETNLLNQINSAGGFASQEGQTLAQQLSPQKAQQLQSAQLQQAKLQGIQTQQSQDQQFKQSISKATDLKLPRKQRENAFMEAALIDGKKTAEIRELFGNMDDDRKVIMISEFDKLRSLKNDERDQFQSELITKYQDDPGFSGFVKALQTLPDVPDEQQNMNIEQAITAHLPKSLMIERLKSKTKGFGDISVKQKEFESLVEKAGLTGEKESEAAMIALGLSPRAVGNAAQTIAKDDITDLVADSQAVIRERTKFGEMTGTSRAKAIDKGFERIAKIDLGIRNIDEAVVAIRNGAGVGAIESQFPSIKAASVELDFVQKKMALDVIGAVTFGALSKGELDLAKEVALPTGLDTDELIDHLQRRKVAQTKLRAYFMEQIQFLDQGGTVAGFLREQERKQGGTQPGQPQQSTTINFDEQGNIIQ